MIKFNFNMKGITMNEVIKAILNRRSTRGYLSEQIKPEELELIIQAGLYAPSACNQQSWHFTIIQNKNILNELNVDSKAEFAKSDDEFMQKLSNDKNYDLFYNAPTIIVISGLKSALVPQVDCAASTQNMLIAAESLNIGSCWIGLLAILFKSDKLSEYINKLNIPDGYEPYYGLALGYKAEENQEVKARRENAVNYL